MPPLGRRRGSTGALLVLGALAALLLGVPNPRIALAQQSFSPEALRAAGAVGDCTRARQLLALPGAPSGSASLLLLARCAIEQPEKDAAVANGPFEILDQVRDGDPLASYARFLEARALLDTSSATLSPGASDTDAGSAALAIALGPREAAAHVLDLLKNQSLPGRSGLDLRLLRDRALVLAGRNQEAESDLLALASTAAGPEARWWLGESSRLRGEKAKARERFQDLWTDAPTRRWSEAAASSLEDLGFSVPEYTSLEGRKTALLRAAAQKAARRPDEALAILRAVEAHGGPSSDPAAIHGRAWLYKMADACFDGHDYPCAVERYALLGSPDGADIPGGAQTVFNHALALSRSGDYAGAARVYTRLFQRFPATKSADLASFKIGYLAFDASDLPAAISAFQAHLDRYPSSSHADEALWFIGWSSWRLGNIDAASAAWKRLVERFPTSPLAPQALYWQARALPPDQETAALHLLQRRFPDSSAAWMATWRIGATRTQVPQPPPLPPIPEAALQRIPALATADALIQVGLLDLADPWLLEARGAAAGEDTATRTAVARRLALTGHVQSAKGLVACTGDVSDDVREICHARPFADVVAGIVSGTGLDPMLPYAIMLAESAMDPTVTSPAGAIGLMQLMPEVAAGLHADCFPDRPFHAEDLYRGAYNTLLGTEELLRLYQHFRGQGSTEPLPLVIAAYNGGEEATDRWLRAATVDGKPPSLDTFCENVGYTETRRYVRTVLGYLETWRRAYGEPP
jgi:TolA-binding protein